MSVFGLGCGSSCFSEDIEERLQGDWVYRLTEEESLRLESMKQILSDEPPTLAELEGMGLQGFDLAAAEKALNLKQTEPDGWDLKQQKERYIEQHQLLNGRRLEVRGPQMTLVEPNQRQTASFEVLSHEGNVSRINTLRSSGEQEEQTLNWISEAHFEMVDSQEVSIQFIRP